MLGLYNSRWKLSWTRTWCSLRQPCTQHVSHCPLSLSLFCPLPFPSLLSSLVHTIFSTARLCFLPLILALFVYSSFFFILCITRRNVRLTATPPHTPHHNPPTPHGHTATAIHEYRISSTPPPPSPLFFNVRISVFFVLFRFLPPVFFFSFFFPKLIDLGSGDIVQDYAAHDKAIWSLDLRPDGKGLVSGSADRQVSFRSDNTGVRHVTG